MKMLINDPAFLRRLIRQRRASRADRYDEVWDGVYIVSPLANLEHQDIAGLIYLALQAAIGTPGLGLVWPGANVSDREEDWRKNYRCPDVVAYLPGNPAINKGSHWLGGPDFAVEVISPHDRSRKKFDFYARVGVRELLLVDRKPWALELYRLTEGKLVLVGRSTPDDPRTLASEVLPLSFRLVAGDPRPRIEVAHSDGVQRWSA
jgi:Uma2 family endonuclease